MAVGSVSFSFCAGAVTSLIANNDEIAQSLKWKLDTLSNIKQQYHLSDDLFEELESSIKFEHSKSIDGFGEFMV